MENRQERFGVREMDAVIVWTDTEEKRYRRQRIDYLRCHPREHEDVPEGRCRDEFLITLGALIKNVPTLRRIHVVSVIPPPHETVSMFIMDNFPDTEVEIAYVSFDELLHGMEGFLPCFSNISAVTLLYRITGLDDRFMLFNVGCIPMENVDLSRFERDGNSIFYGRKCRSDAISMDGKEKILVPGRLPVLTSRKAIEKCLAGHPGILKENLRHRFDSPRSRHNPQGQTDIMILLANSPDSLAVDEQDRRTDHGTMVLRLSPGDDLSFSRRMKECGQVAFLDFAPFRAFPVCQRQAVSDFLCHKLQIRLP